MINTLIGLGKFTIFTDALLINSLQSQKNSISDFKVVKSVRKIETFKHHWFNSASALINICFQSKSDDYGDFVEFLNISRPIIWGTVVQIPGLTIQPSSVSVEFRMIPPWFTVSLLHNNFLNWCSNCLVYGYVWVPDNTSLHWTGLDRLHCGSTQGLQIKNTSWWSSLHCKVTRYWLHLSLKTIYHPSTDETLKSKQIFKLQFQRNESFTKVPAICFFKLNFKNSLLISIICHYTTP